jgi:2-dehydropantoate 2-reductase
MKVLLVGCGAVGLSMATALHTSGTEVHLAARGETGAAIRKNGVERWGILGQAVIPPGTVQAFDTPEDAEGGYDFIINSVKATGNAEVAAGLARRKNDILGPEGRLVLFQNGYGNEQAFTGIFSQSQIYHASFAIGFKRPKPWISEVTVITSPVSIGSIFGCPPEACGPLAEALDCGGIPCRISDEIGKILWAKLLYNCTLNPLSAILKTNYGGLLKSSGSVSIMEAVIDEVFAVMHGAGHETFWENAASYKKEFFDKILPPTYGHRSSTLQDIERQIPTEIDSLNGAVVKLGEQLGIETPRNTVLTQLIKSMEALYETV